MSNSTAVEPELLDLVDAVFGDYRMTHPGPVAPLRDPELWHRLDELGLVRLTGRTETGGSGAGWLEAAELLAAAVRHGIRGPLAEHDLLACWLLEEAEIPVGAAVRTVCQLDHHGVATAVPWASGAERIAVLWREDGEHRIADVAVDELALTRSDNAIGEPRDTVVAERARLRGVALDPALLTQLRWKAALVRAIQVCAALDESVELCLEHTASRTQFGRPLSRFQAVQNLIADSAAEAALARATTEAALAAALAGDWSTPDLEFLVAVARSCTGHAASTVVRNTHQVHGAIGTTREHRLHEFTRAALAWRSEFGSVRHWDDVVSRAALRAGGAGLWNQITSH